MKNHVTEILLVEDNHLEAKLTISSLKEFSLADNLVHVDDGAEALDFIFARGKFAHRLNDKHPRVILLDLNLPKIGGLEVLRQIKSNEQTKSIPVVILSSSNMDSDIARAYQFGVNSYVVKPVDFEVFFKAITDLGAYWKSLNQSHLLH